MSRPLVALLGWLAVTAVPADERIHDYRSDILVRADGWIEVTETISVRAENRQIRRGIYRDYPVRYRDRFGNRVEVLYEPRGVLRDGDAEPFHVEALGDDVRTYFGSADRLLPPGDHTYVYRYDAGRMLGFFDEHDELYWNVNGDGWAFPIDRVSATVRFEFPVAPAGLRLDAYTGVPGARGTDYTAKVDSRGVVQFATTRALPPGENLTIAVGWPKGLVAEPTLVERTGWLLAANVNLLVALAGLAGMLAWYLPMWRKHGKDPEPGVVFTRYEPPAGFSPASLRYIEKMGYDDDAMTAAVISLATKGRLRIDVDEDDEHTLIRCEHGPGAAPLSAGETELLDALFEEGDTLLLENDNYERVAHAREAHERSLKFDYHRRYFVTNGLMNIIPFLVGAAAAAVAVAIRPSVLVVLTMVAMVVTFLVFAWLMKRPTGLGRRLLDEVDGFREYLEIAEKDELNLRNPPEKTPELFERYLPYALSLGVEQQWAERFSRIFASLRGPNDRAWQPAWYNGTWRSSSLSSSISSLSSGLGGAISTSRHAPGSSSGGGGGGSSGGGGGGGGGGGW